MRRRTRRLEILELPATGQRRWKAKRLRLTLLTRCDKFSLQDWLWSHFWIQWPDWKCTSRINGGYEDLNRRFQYYFDVCENYKIRIWHLIHVCEWVKKHRISKYKSYIFFTSVSTVKHVIVVCIDLFLINDLKPIPISWLNCWYCHISYKGKLTTKLAELLLSNWWFVFRYLRHQNFKFDNTTTTKPNNRTTTDTFTLNCCNSTSARKVYKT